MSQEPELHFAVGSARALGGDVGDVTQTAHVHTGLQPPLQPAGAAAPLGGTSRAGTPTPEQQGSHYHTHVLETHNVKMPDFMPENAQNWFNQLEIQFRAKRITSDITKYFTTSARLPQDLNAGLSWDAQYYAEGQRYESLKRDVLRRCEKDRLHKAKSFLNHRRFPTEYNPYQIYDELVNPIRARPMDVVHAVFLSHLPKEVARHVRPEWLDDKDTLLAECNALWQRYTEYSVPSQSVAQVSAAPTSYYQPAQYGYMPAPAGSQMPAPYQQAQFMPTQYQAPIAPYQAPVAPCQPQTHTPISDAEIEQVCMAYSANKPPGRGGKRGGQGGRNQRRPPIRVLSDPHNMVCDLHFTFGAKAKRCVGSIERPCNFQQSGNGQPGR